MDSVSDGTVHLGHDLGLTASVNNVPSLLTSSCTAWCTRGVHARVCTGPGMYPCSTRHGLRPNLILILNSRAEGETGPRLRLWLSLWPVSVSVSVSVSVCLSLSLSLSLSLTESEVRRGQTRARRGPGQSQARVRPESGHVWAMFGLVWPVWPCLAVGLYVLD